MYLIWKYEHKQHFSEKLFQITGNTLSDQINRIKSWHLSKVYIIYTKIEAKGLCKMAKMIYLEGISL